MTLLIAVEGDSLNSGLLRATKSRKREEKQRFRIDHDRLAEFLTNEVVLGDEENAQSLATEKFLRYYVDQASLKTDEPNRKLGKVNKYFAAKGYGFIVTTDGSSYFFHNNEILNKKALCEGRETRFPRPTSGEFGSRILNKIVSFEVVEEDGKTRAEAIRLEFSKRVLDRYFALRRQPFLEMLQDNGYEVIKCLSGDNDSGVFSRICIDALCELEEGDSFILISESVIFSELLYRLDDFGINTTLLTFRGSESEALRNELEDTRVLFLDDFLDDLELCFDDEELSQEIQLYSLS